MKKLVIILGLMVLCVGQAQAYRWYANTKDTVNTTTLISGASQLGYISVSNSEATPRRVDMYDSISGQAGTYIGSVVVPTKDSRFYTLQIRLTYGLVVVMSGAHMSITTAYESSAHGFYPYGVQNKTTQDTVYNSPGDIIGLLVANWNADTGAWVTLEDSGTRIVRINCPANDTVYVFLDRVRLNNKFQVQMEKTNMSVMAIRRD